MYAEEYLKGFPFGYLGQRTLYGMRSKSVKEERGFFGKT